MLAGSPEQRLSDAGVIRQDFRGEQPRAPAANETDADDTDADDTPEVKTPLTLLRFEDIDRCLDANDFVQGILTRQSAIVVYGDSNSGKTFWTTDLALHIAAGKVWNGRRVEQGGVVYCVLEGGMGFRNRIAAWRAHHGMDDARIPFAAIQAPLNLLDPDADTPRLIEAIGRATKQGMTTSLVVIDTLSRALAGGNENAPEDMGALVRNMDAIRSSTSAAVLFVHHSGKDAARGARGHSLLRAAIDTEIEVSAPEGTDQRKVEIVKQRDLPKGANFGFRLDVVELGRNLRFNEAVTTCVVEHCDAAPASRGRLKGDAALAYDILNDAIAEHGSIHPDAPPGVQSTTTAQWRDRFYDRAKAGASQDTKSRAFRRAADTLITGRRVATRAERVWVV